ncbi:hypothetical protein H7K43_06330 [Streptomyces sp. TYQ1024]|nr:hypothetical protein [Streptomyces sp. TYQ1024]
MEVLLLDVEADLSVREDGRTVWAEDAFPAAELAYQLGRWLRGADADRGDFTFDSLQAEPGTLRIAEAGEGRWRVGSGLAPAWWTAPVAWDVLTTEIGRLDRSVREGLAALGVGPDVLPAL